MSFLDCPKQRNGRRAKDKCWSFEPDVDIDSVSWGDILAEDDGATDVISEEETWEDFDDFFTKTPEETSEVEIVKLYEQLAAINQKRIQNPADHKLTARADEVLKRLRLLQTQEALRIRQRFERNLTMPIDAGASVLEEVKQLLMKYEDPTANSSAS